MTAISTPDPRPVSPGTRRVPVTRSDARAPAELAKWDSDRRDRWMGSGAGALFRAVGFYAGPEPTVTADNVLDALIAFANGDVSPRRPAEDERRRARRMLTAAAEGVINPLSKSLLAWLSNDTLSNMSGRQVHRTPACREVHQTPDFSYAH